LFLGNIIRFGGLLHKYLQNKSTSQPNPPYLFTLLYGYVCLLACCSCGCSGAICL